MTTKTTARTLLSAFSGIALATALLASPAALADDDKKTEKPTKVTQPAKSAQPTTPDADKAKDGEKSKEKGKSEDSRGKSGSAGAVVGQPAPAFTLTDTDGKTVSLGDHLKDGKTIVVLEWFNPQCPLILKHHDSAKTFNDLHAKYSGKNVVFLAINSGAPGEQGAGAEKSKKGKTDFSLPYPILIDEAGTVGKAYGAKTTPHCFVIAANGTVAYNGAIDDNPGRDLGKVNYVGQALDELLAGTSVTTPTTKPYGCGVKYAK